MFSERTFLRLDLLRFPLIVGVVYIHAYENWVEIAGQVVGVTAASSTADFVRNAISQGIARLSVPMLFLVSGYLFFREGEFTRSGYFRKVRARIHTLVLPLIFWNVFVLSVIGCLQSIPATALFFSGRNIPIGDYSLYDIVAAVFGIGRAPIAHQFWFVRDLLILLLLAPIFAGLLRISPWPTLTLFLTCWYLDLWPLAAPSAEATLFVAIGYFLALTRRDLFSLDRYGPAAVIAYVVLLTTDALFYGTSFGRQVHSLSVPFGMVALLYLSGKVIDFMPRLTAALISLSGASFFVFAAHDPLLTAVRKLAFSLVESESTLLLLYFTVPALVIVGLVVLHRTLHWLAPQLTFAISGGR
jgi:surface polysaccharide O-acyltransferase-like enzyme